MKVKYQYTYFISPFKIKEEDYGNYIKELKNNKNLKQIIFEKEKYISMNEYFLENVKNILFFKDAICFEYLISNESQTEAENSGSINYRIDKLNLICFKNGIGFIIIKTVLENSENLENILNFNYKFRKLNIENGSNINFDDKINIKAIGFKDNAKITSIIENLSKSKINQMYTYSYVCIDGEYWNDKTKFENIKSSILKLVNALPANVKAEGETEFIEKSKYIKFGFTKNSTALITNSLDSYNCTKLPFEFETNYLYTYIFLLYQKYTIIDLNKKLGQNCKFKKVKEEVNYFVDETFIKDITNEELGTKLFKKWNDKLDITNNYLELIDKYELAYKTNKAKIAKRTNDIMMIILIMCLAINVVDVIILATIKK